MWYILAIIGVLFSNIMVSGICILDEVLLFVIMGIYLFLSWIWYRLSHG